MRNNLNSQFIAFRPRLFLSLMLLAITLGGCATNTTAPQNPYQKTFDQAGVRSILVVPATNGSVNIYAPDTMLSVLPIILAERGYYVFPVNTVKVVLENEGLYEAAEIHQLPAEKLALMFGANTILYVNVEYWDTQYVVIASNTKVVVSFRLVSDDGTELWRATQTVQRSAQDNSSSSGNVFADLIGDAISAALERAFPDYRPLAKEASNAVFTQGSRRIPLGPYHPSVVAAEIAE